MSRGRGRGFNTSRGGNKGKALEAAINSFNESYSLTRIAFINQTAAPYDIMGHPDDNDVFRVKLTGKGPPDYMGLLHGGTPVVFEAKEVLNAAEAFQWTSIKVHQARNLAQAHRRGALSFIVFGFKQECWLVLWKDIEALYVPFRRRKLRGERSLGGTNRLSLQQCRDLGRRIRIRGDWLSAVTADPPLAVIPPGPRDRIPVF